MQLSSMGRRRRTGQPYKQNKSAGIWGEVALVILAFGALGWALYLSVPVKPPSGDLRTAYVVGGEAALALLVALGFLVWAKPERPWAGLGWSFAYAAWSAAIFRLVPPIIYEHPLYSAGLSTDGWLVVALCAGVHGAIVVLTAWPFAERVLQIRELTFVDIDTSATNDMAVATALIFIITAAVVRFMADVN